MLVNMNDVLLPAKKGRYAVGLFDAVNLEMVSEIWVNNRRNYFKVLF